jgi:hypothetical protein
VVHTEEVPNIRIFAMPIWERAKWFALMFTSIHFIKNLHKNQKHWRELFFNT